MVSFLIWFLLNALTVWAVAALLPGASLRGVSSTILTVLILGLANAVIRPLLIVLTLPLSVLTFGLFILVINALLVMLTAALVPGFDIANFWWALLFSVLLALLNSFLFSLVR